MHILLIEDDLDLGASLVRSLQQDGFTVQWLRRAHDAPLQPDDPGCSAVLLDLGLPDGSGMELLRRWRRAQAGAPVLVITARSALQDRLGGLDAGADDYLVKPFDIPELLARLRAVLRRTAAQSGEQWQFGALSVWPR